MSSIAEQISSSRGLLKALESATNCRAFFTVLGTLIVGLLVGGLIAILSSQFGGGAMSFLLGFVGLLISLAIFMAGFSAAGFIVNDQVRGREQRKIGDAIVAAMLTLPRLIGVALLIALIGLLVAIAIIIALFLCKIPVIGPILYVVVFPAAVLTIGACWYASMFVVALAAPAIWEGNTVMGTLGILWAIVRQRLVAAVIHSLLLALLVGVVAGLIMGALMLGTAFTAGLSAAILNVGNFGGVMGGLTGRAMGMGMAMGFGGGGYLMAGAIGGGVITACAIVVPALVAIAGNCIIFANLSENLATGDYQAQIAGAFDAMKQKANAARQQLDAQRQKPATAQAVEPAPSPGTESPAPAAIASSAVVASGQVPAPPVEHAIAASCAQCGASVKSDDVFCGHCGARLE